MLTLSKKRSTPKQTVSKMRWAPHISSCLTCLWSVFCILPILNTIFPHFPLDLCVHTISCVPALSMHKWETWNMNNVQHEYLTYLLQSLQSCTHTADPNYLHCNWRDLPLLNMSFDLPIWAIECYTATSSWHFKITSRFFLDPLRKAFYTMVMLLKPNR